MAGISLIRMYNRKPNEVVMAFWQEIPKKSSVTNDLTFFWQLISLLPTLVETPYIIIIVQTNPG